MLNYHLDFLIEKEKTETFLLGSKSLFPAIEKTVELFSKSIDIDVKPKFKMEELEKERIQYLFTLEIDYPGQDLLWGGYEKSQIDNWFRFAVDIILGDLDISNIDLVAKELELDGNFIYIKISEKNLQNNLADLKKLSILLFKNLYYFENEDDQK